MTQYRVCGCGFEGQVEQNECPDCGTDWFVPVADNGGAADKDA